jgi:predicted CoA-binding protein
MEPTQQEISTILAQYKTIAVVGLSAKPNRASHDVTRYMQQHGYRIIPVNPTYAGTHILNELCYSTLTEAATALAKEGIKIELVDCFRKSSDIGPVAEEAIAIGAQCLWMQLGIVNEEAAAKARAGGMQVVMDRCIKVDHMRSQPD